MAARGVGSLTEAMRSLGIAARASHPTKTFARTMATEAPMSQITKTADTQKIMQSWNPASSVPVTIHSFPWLEPKTLEQWSVEHLYLPLRRDLLHMAVVYEGDHTRLGTASVKTRYEVHGSHRKVHAQKGSGRARVGTKQSPIRRGGGKTFGPHPRDFGTKLNRKVYDKAWRTALSYRYRRGELLVCEDGMDLAMPADFELVADKFLKDGLRETYMAKYMTGVLGDLGLGKADGRTLFVTSDRRQRLFDAIEQVPWEGRALDLDDVDVKDLLEDGKVILERSVLKEMIDRHQSDLVSKILVGGFTPGPESGQKILGA
ncbi:large subunit ribosomal protein L4 [Geosmithia morbida]|uniref:Large ribosomal subunit protein uL4m n=1 Tax=Geosmithia morbida TaxID=1094350 RepID=A0A9P4YPA0_9HYPO|nr:large subunit ribosomal protein L4 [Geosmithia morbida]KAF4120623.1 large subunit ribosomal protein L4 [Geosmithia morbida]